MIHYIMDQLTATMEIKMTKGRIKLELMLLEDRLRQVRHLVEYQEPTIDEIRMGVLKSQQEVADLYDRLLGTEIEP